MKAELDVGLMGEGAASGWLKEVLCAVPISMLTPVVLDIFRVQATLISGAVPQSVHLCFVI
jgi:hypothetical protein